MTTTDDKPTTAERYARAIGSSHLEVTDQRGDVDVLIAAGWVKSGLGSALYRLMVEFDTVRARLNGQAGNLQTERLLILMELRSLKTAREHMGQLANEAAGRAPFMEPAAVFKVAGRVLDVWLDDICHHCAGRGFNGGEHRGEHKTLCRPCHGSGKRRGWIGKNQAEQQVAAGMLAQMDRELDDVSKAMRRYLRNE